MEGVFIVESNNEEETIHECTFNKIRKKSKSRTNMVSVPDTYSSDVVIKNISDSKKCRLKIIFNSKDYIFHFLQFPDMPSGYIIEVSKKNGYINMSVSLNVYMNDIKGVIITIN